MPTAYSYIRFSTPEQQKGDSLRRQSELSEEYATRHGLTLDSSLRLRDLGLSAFDRSNVERGALGAFLKAIEQGRIASGSYLLVESLDRLSRAQVMDALQVFVSILKQGIIIVTLADGMIYRHDDNNVANLIISITIMARAHEESLTKSKRLKAAWSNKRTNILSRKLTAQCPKWMKLSADKTEFEFIPERAEVVRRIVGWAKDGMGQAQIAKRLNEQSVPSFSDHGNGWHNSYVQKILTNSALYGQFQPGVFEKGKVIPHGDAIENYYPALISKDEFFLLQSFRSERATGGAKARKGSTVSNLLSGIVKCGYCRSTMVMAGAAAKRIRSEDGSEVKRPARKVLVCDSGRRGLECFAVQWDYKDFERSFLSFCRSVELKRILTNLKSANIAGERKLSVREKLQAIVSEIGETQRRLNNLIDAIEAGDALASVRERIRKTELKLEGLDKSKQQYEAELLLLEGTDRQLESASESIRDLIEKMESLTGDDLFSVRVALADQIRRTIEVIQVHPAGRLVSADTVQKMRFQMLEGGIGPDEVEEHLSNYRIEPLRQGRGNRGRYASRRDIGRFFVVHSKNGGFQTAYPNFDDPCKLDFGAEAVPKEGGGYNKIRTSGLLDWIGIPDDYAESKQ